MHPEIRFAMPVLYSSRKPRPGEKEGEDFYFRPEEMIRHLPAEQFVIGKARTVWQALDLREVQTLFAENDLLVLEVYPTIARQFLEHPLMQKNRDQFRLTTVFISPLYDEEIIQLQEKMGFATPEEAVAAVMLPKLVGRSQQQGKLITPGEMDDLRIRAIRAYSEMVMGKDYDIIIVNHDGEDSRHWNYLPPIGDAGQTLKAFMQILLE